MNQLDALRTALNCGRTHCVCTRGSMLHCPAHADRTPSLSVRAVGPCMLVHCFGGCPERAIVDALRARGLWASGQGQQPQLRSIHAEALALVLHQPWSRPEVLALYQAGDAIRHRYRLAQRLRRAATLAGDCRASWTALARAATFERAARVAETLFDEPIRDRVRARGERP